MKELVELVNFESTNMRAKICTYSVKEMFLLKCEILY